VGRLYYGSISWPWTGTNSDRPNAWSGPLTTSTNNAPDLEGNAREEGIREAKLVSTSAIGGSVNKPLPVASQGQSLHRNDDERILSEIETGILDVFSDAYCNKHFIYGFLELVLVRLLPELAEKGITELWEERLN
jgi:hypothetical protein